MANLPVGFRSSAMAGFAFSLPGRQRASTAGAQSAPPGPAAPLRRCLRASPTASACALAAGWCTRDDVS
eukprot:410771-Alexandrium_andersonii.AAC.1